VYCPDNVMLHICCTRVLLQIFDALYNSKVPSAWLKTYPSLKALGPWTRDLLARIEQLARWVEGTYPRLYWLGGFTYPTGFLTAVLQVYVHSASWLVCQLSEESWAVCVAHATDSITRCSLQTAAGCTFAVEAHDRSVLTS
jgi:hypothetical protein